MWNTILHAPTRGVMAEHLTEIEKQRHALDESSKVCRAGYFWFILVSVYVILVIAATTDKQLFLMSSLELPVLNFDVPVTTLYLIVPPLYILSHFYTLLQLSLLMPRIHHFCEQCEHLKPDDRTNQKLLLLPFVFNESILKRVRSPVLLGLIRLQVWLTLFVLPLVIMLFLQYRYLPMHAPNATRLHQWFVCLHVGMTVYFWIRANSHAWALSIAAGWKTMIAVTRFSFRRPLFIWREKPWCRRSFSVAYMRLNKLTMVKSFGRASISAIITTMFIVVKVIFMISCLWMSLGILQLLPSQKVINDTYVSVEWEPLRLSEDQQLLQHMYGESDNNQLNALLKTDEKDESTFWQTTNSNVLKALLN